MKSKPTSPLFLALALGLALVSASAQERPNVLFISVDDLNDMPTFMGRYSTITKTISTSGPISPSCPNTTHSRTNSNPGSLENTSRSHSASKRGQQMMAPVRLRCAPAWRSDRWMRVCPGYSFGEISSTFNRISRYSTFIGGPTWTCIPISPDILRRCGSLSVTSLSRTSLT